MELYRRIKLNIQDVRLMLCKTSFQYEDVGC